MRIDIHVPEGFEGKVSIDDKVIEVNPKKPMADQTIYDRYHGEVGRLVEKIYGCNGVTKEEAEKEIHSLIEHHILEDRKMNGR